MNANQIYNLNPNRVTTELYVLKGFYADLLPEINSIEGMEDYNEKVQIKYYVDYCFDGRRTWTLASVWYESNPVMIIQRAGREGDDHYERFITDVDNFKNMVHYLSENDKEIEVYKPHVINPNVDIDELTRFYGHFMTDFYDETYIPKYKVGDIVKIKNSKSYKNLEDYDTMIEVDATISTVTNMRIRPYFATELNRCQKFTSGHIWCTEVLDGKPNDEEELFELMVAVDENLNKIDR